MLLAAPLALVLLAAPLDEGRGSAGTTPEDALLHRTSPRWRLGLGGGVLFGLANYSPSLGVGLTADLGVVLGDRFSLFAHAEGGTIVLTVIGSGALLVEYALSEHFSAGLGLAFSLWSPVVFGGFNSSFYGLTLPLRVNFSPATRASHETRRSGLLIGLQVAPGVSLQPRDFFQLNTPLAPEFALSATVSVGYAWW